MNTQNEMGYISDWQMMGYSGRELENNQETDGNEEDMEFGFFDYSQDDHKSHGEMTKA